MTHKNLNTERKNKSTSSRMIDVIGIAGSWSSIFSFAGALVSAIIVGLFSEDLLDGSEAKNYFQLAAMLGTYAFVSHIFNLWFARKAINTESELLKTAEQIQSLQTSKDNQSNLLHSLEAVVHESACNSRRLAVRTRQYEANDDLDSSESHELYHRCISNWRKHSQLHIDNVAYMFRLLTGKECSATIKVISWQLEEGQDQRIQTLVRDNISKRHRKRVDNDMKYYPVQSNTAFNHIVQSVDFDAHFACNNLNASASYLNSHESWRKHYNSTLVVPIGSEHYEIEENGHDQPCCYDLVGFLCIDSQNANLEDSSSVMLAKMLAKVYNEYLNYVARIFFAKVRNGTVTELLRNEVSIDTAARFKRLAELEAAKTLSNRAIGMRILKTKDASGRQQGVNYLRTPMAIHSLCHEWKDSPKA